MATTKHDATSHQRAQVVARYEQLLEALGEDPFRPTSALQRAEDATRVVDTAASAETRAQLLATAARNSLRCAELIEQALEASARLGHVQKKISDARRAHARGDGSEDEEEDEDDGDEDMEGEAEGKTALLLEDLVAVGGELQDAGRKYAQLGVASKTARSSRALLSVADQSLEEAMAASAGATGAAGAAAVHEEFRDLYMDEFTRAFGDDLDAFRQEERFESKDVTYLISCIHAGADIFSPLQKKLFVEAAAASASSA